MLKNTSIVIIGNILFKLISLFVTIILARYLGIADFGKYSFIYAYTAFFGILTDLGIQTILVREMSQDYSKSSLIFGNSYVIKLIFTVMAIIVSIICIFFLPYPITTKILVSIASFNLLFASLSNLYGTIFQTNLKMEYTVIPKLLSRISSAVIILYIIMIKGSLLQIIIAILFSEVIRLLASYLFSRKYINLQIGLNLQLWKNILKNAIPIAFFNVIWIFYYQVDILMLSFIKGDVSVGLYSAATKLNEPIGFFVEASIITLFPVMSSLAVTSNEKLKYIYINGLRYIVIFMLLVAVVATILSDNLIHFIYGEQFSNSADVFIILIWSLVFISMNSFLSHFLISIDNQKAVAKIYFISAAINIFLNYVLIPTYDYGGAAFATLITNIILLFLNYNTCSSKFTKASLTSIFIKPFIGIAFTILFTFFFSELN
ncbi:flippase, partial [Methanolobus vulcani]